MSHNLSLEEILIVLRKQLESLETRQAIQNGRWERTLAFTPDEKKPALEAQINRQKARNDHEKNVLLNKIHGVEAQITRQAEETRKLEERRAWLEPIKEQARQSWIHDGGQESSFEASWPEMERRLLMQTTLESLAVPPKMTPEKIEHTEPSTKRKWHSWDPIKPPAEPGKRKRTS